MLLCKVKKLLGRLERGTFMWNAVAVLLVFRVVLWHNGIS